VTCTNSKLERKSTVHPRRTHCTIPCVNKKSSGVGSMNCPSGRERVRKRSISTNARPSVVEVVGCTGIELARWTYFHAIGTFIGSRWSFLTEVSVESGLGIQQAAQSDVHPDEMDPRKETKTTQLRRRLDFDLVSSYQSRVLEQSLIERASWHFTSRRRDALFRISPLLRRTS